MIAAHRGGVDTAIIPRENEKDLKDLPAIIERALKIILVDHTDEVPPAASALPHPQAFFRDGFHDIEDTWKLPGSPAPAVGETDISHPAGVN